MTETELDVRPLRKPDKHPTIFATFDKLEPGESFVLVNNHDPIHLHDEFDTEYPGAYGWEYVQKEIREFRIRITKTTSTALPRVLANTSALTGEADAVGAVWKLPMARRDLDSNVIRLAPGDGIESHTGPDLDVLIHVLQGSGAVVTEAGEVALSPGDLLWLPRRSRRQFVAGSDGLCYLTVHQRRQSLLLNSAPPA